MASETSDLTFVRCPSCRSLVPASASRCRICNNPLDGLNKEQPDPAKSGGRVRQKTITASPEEVDAVLQAAQSAASKPPPPPPPVAAPTQAAAPEADDFDPLGAYLQEMESGGAPEPQLETKPASSVPSPLDDDDLFDLDIFDEPIAEPAPVAARAPEPVAAEPVRDEAPVVRGAPESPREARPKFEAPPARPAPPVTDRPRESRPSQPQQNGGQPANRSGGGGEQRRQESRPQESRPQQQQEQRPPKQNQNQGFQAKQNQQQPQQRREERKPDRPPRQDPPRREPEARRDGGQERAPVAGPKTGKMRPGRLFGWLVSYENPDGRAIELREGKFFVTSSSIKGSDLILEDPSISTPHALMSISDSGLLVQDLMSDHGVFVRAGDDGSYRREDGVIRVSHGDWLKFGDVEFLVIIVPSSSRQG